jgi:hypothetical protein
MRRDAEPRGARRVDVGAGVADLDEPLLRLRVLGAHLAGRPRMRGLNPTVPVGAGGGRPGRD